MKAIRPGSLLQRAFQQRISAACGLMLLATLGSMMPASAQEIDFTGEWRPLYHEDGPERLPGPELGDFAGIPLNEAGRLQGYSYNPNRMSIVTEFTCRQHGADYSMRGLSNMRITRVINEQTEQTLAFRMRMGNHAQSRTIWLDGRSHPPSYAAHTWQGFSTGTFKGNSLVIRTTHLKENYIRRNGLPASSERTFLDYWMRHGNYLTVVTVIEDPVYLTERLVRSQSWVLDPGQRLAPNTCEYTAEVPMGASQVPHYLPGRNPFVNEFAERYGLPLSGPRGGAETMYPEFRLTMGPPATRPERCTLYCRCMNEGSSCPDKP